MPRMYPAIQTPRGPGAQNVIDMNRRDARPGRRQEMIDYTPGKPDFNILRLGHIEYLVSDLARARDFYVDVVGLFETESDTDHVYLRAIEDREHHSVVLTRSPSPASAISASAFPARKTWTAWRTSSPAWACPCAGWRPARNAARAALRVQDPFGFQVEYYAHMEQAPWLLQQYHLHRHGCPTRLDHLNVLMPDAQAGFDWYTRELASTAPNSPPRPRPRTRVGQLAVPQGHHPRHRRDDGQGPERAPRRLLADGAHGRDPRLRRAGRRRLRRQHRARPGPPRHFQRAVRLCAIPMATASSSTPATT